MIIKCPECGREVSDKATSCPHCGCPISQPQSVNQNISEEYLACPHCGSRDIHADQKGFSGGKALVGGLVAGPLGLLAGTVGKNDVTLTCLKCGHKFKAGEALVVTGNTKSLSEEDNMILSMVKEKGAITATKYYKDSHKCDLKEAYDYVHKLCADNHVPVSNTANNSGCMVFIAIAIIITSLIFI
jgi:DNA-directed RNA polymerase subunit RPC12/RpoP